ncbi:MAG TPA: DinB family protein [Ignavibacteria bacterium]|nr:DinB family protein [Ignavibacteria bacterium]
MYTSISLFLKDWKYESEATVKLMKNLTDESLNQKVTPDGRSLGFISWHVALTIPEMLGKTGLKLDGPSESSPIPGSAKEILDAFDKASKSLSEQIEKNWTDETLETEDEMYGEKWKKGMTLSALILHQAHHRGQMTVLMRQAGLKVTGVYGPSKEEWADMGMDPME